MLSINTDLQDILLRSTLDKSTLSLSDVINKMTTGYKVNHAKDNAANYSIITDLSKRISSMLQVQQNTEDGIALLSLAEGGLQEIQEQLERLRELTMQASTGSYDSTTRAKMQQEADSIINEINRLRKSMECEGRGLYYSEEIEPLMDKINTVISQAKATRNLTSPAVPSSLSPNSSEPVAGTVELQASETKEVVIDGVSYTLKNTSTSVQTFEYSKDKSTKQLTITCNNLEITGQNNVSHNIILNGSHNSLTTGEKDDEIIINAPIFSIEAGAGDDTYYIHSKVSNIEDAAGDDTYYLEIGGHIGNSIVDGDGVNNFHVNNSDTSLTTVGRNLGAKNTFYVNGNGNTIQTDNSQNLFVLLGNANRVYGNDKAPNYYVNGAGASNSVYEAVLLQENAGVLMNGKGTTVSLQGTNFILSRNTSSSLPPKMTYFVNPLTNNIEFIGDGYTIEAKNSCIDKNIVLQGDSNQYLFHGYPITNCNFILERGENNNIVFNIPVLDTNTLKVKSDNNVFQFGNVSTFDLEVFGSGNLFQLHASSSLPNANVYGKNNIFNLGSQRSSTINLYGDSNTVMESTGTQGSSNTVNINSSYNTVRLLPNVNSSNPIPLDECSINGDWNNVTVGTNKGDLNIVGNNNTVTNYGLTNKDGAPTTDCFINITGQGNTVQAERAANLNIVGQNNNFNSYGDLLTLNIEGNENSIELQGGPYSFSTNASIIGDLNTLSDANDRLDNNTKIVGNNNTLTGGAGIDIYTVTGNNNVLNGGENNDMFTIKSGNQNVVDGNAGDTNVLINRGKNTSFTNAIDATLNGFKLDLKVGIGSNDSSVVTEEISFDTFGFDVDLSTQDAARDSLSLIDEMLTNVNEQILSIGTSINRLELILDEQSINIENMISTRSTFRDADMAKESSKFIKNQIIQQASATLLSMSRNLRQESVLGLLYGIS